MGNDISNPKNNGAIEINNVAAINIPQQIITNGLFITVFTLVIMPVTKSISLSMINGMDTTVTENRNNEKQAPTVWPTITNVQPSDVVVMILINESHDENDMRPRIMATSKRI